MPRKSKLDKLLELVKNNDNPEVIKLIEELSQESKIKPKSKKSKTKSKNIEKDDESAAVLPNVALTNSNVGFKENLWKDDGTLCQSDREFDKRFKMKPQERSRPVASQKEIRCNRCGKSYKVYNITSTFYICAQCARG
jgi:hypothetical protein